MTAPKFDMDRAARDFVAALPRKGPDGKHHGGDLDAAERILAALAHGNEGHTVATFATALASYASDILGALEARDGAADG